MSLESSRINSWRDLSRLREILSKGETALIGWLTKHGNGFERGIRSMIGRKILVFVNILGFLSLATLSAQNTAFEVTTALVTTKIENRVPETQTSENRFPATVDKLIYFTQLEEAAAPTTILHEWYWEGKLLASVPLAVKAERWRTWSSKTIMPHQTGSWTVVSKRPDGSTAQNTSFSIDNDMRTVQLHIESNPSDAIVYEGSTILGTTGTDGLNIVWFWEEGEYTLDITKPGYQSGAIKLTVEDPITRVQEVVQLQGNP